MRKEPSDRLRSVANWFALACCLAILAGDAVLGSSASLEWWLRMLLYLPWQAGPILLAAACAALSRDSVGQRVFLLLAALLAALTAWTYYSVVTSTSSTAPIALLVWPLFLYAGWLATVIVAAIFGWRARSIGSA